MNDHVNHLILRVMHYGVQYGVHKAKYSNICGYVMKVCSISCLYWMNFVISSTYCVFSYCYYTWNLVFMV
jgi:hypothetical protein